MGQLLVPHSWQRRVFKLVSLHTNLDAGIVSVSNSELNSVARNHCWTLHNKDPNNDLQSSDFLSVFVGEEQRQRKDGQWGRP